ncbi:zinc ribbon domain-containing protein [bacterium]|nr:zinc ribbon domain-containing protein [bacterium]
MPLYEFSCRSCGAKFDMLRRLSDKDEEVTCPECGEQQAERQVSAVTCTSNAVGSGTFSPAACTRFS